MFVGDGTIVTDNASAHRDALTADTNRPGLRHAFRLAPCRGPCGMLMATPTRIRAGHLALYLNVLPLHLLNVESLSEVSSLRRWACPAAGSRRRGRRMPRVPRLDAAG
jgi:hypothetical protein